MTNQLVRDHESQVLKTLSAISLAKNSPTAPWWNQVVGGYTAARQAVVAGLYSNIPLEFFQKIATPDANGMYPNYLEFNSDWVGSANRLVDLQIHNCVMQNEDTLTIDLHPRFVIDNGGHLSRIGSKVYDFVKGWTCGQTNLRITRESIEKGSIRQADFDALVAYAAFWKEQQDAFEATKAEGSTITNWTYVKENPNRNKILSVVPLNDNFQALFELYVNVYQSGDTFRVGFSLAIQNIKNFTLLGKGIRRTNPIDIDNGLDNPALTGQIVPQPDYRLREQVPAMPAYNAAPVAPGYVPSAANFGQQNAYAQPMQPPAAYPAAYPTAQTQGTAPLQYAPPAQYVQARDHLGQPAFDASGQPVMVPVQTPVVAQQAPAVSQYI